MLVLQRMSVKAIHPSDLQVGPNYKWEKKNSIGVTEDSKNKAKSAAVIRK